MVSRKLVSDFFRARVPLLHGDDSPLVCPQIPETFGE